MINRKTQPAFKQVESIDILEANKITLKNGIDVYIIDSGTQDVVKIDVTFDAGSWQQDKPLVAVSTNSLLNEGTKTRSSAQIAEELDFHGAYLDANAYFDSATVTLFTLNKHLEKTILLLNDIIKNPVFPESELKHFVDRGKQSYEIENTKVSVIARRNFQKALFGINHPYGRYIMAKDYDALERNDLQSYFEKYYHYNNCHIIVSGKVTDNAISLIEKHFGDSNWGNASMTNKKEFSANTEQNKEIIIEKDDVIQTAIRMGRVLVKKSHPDYIGLKLLNTIIGGYYGSRLMAKLREEKGYTYGISSGIVPLKQIAFFTITTEVANEFTDNAIEEIYNELKILATVPVPVDELQLVKNYSMGRMLKALDGPFRLADSLDAMLMHGLDYNFYQRFINETREITQDDIIRLTNKYFKPEDLTIVVAGKKIKSK